MQAVKLNAAFNHIQVQVVGVGNAGDSIEDGDSRIHPEDVLCANLIEIIETSHLRPPTDPRPSNKR